MQRQVDKARTERCFAESDLVYLKLQQSVFRLPPLLPKTLLQILWPIQGAVAYKLKLPPGSQIHPVFHVTS
jgi:hypothetical protein